MPERIDWLADSTASGTPYSPRFGDRYRSELGGLDQARDVFLKGCGLPAAWADQPQWTVLETGFGLGLNFLVTWQAWKHDAQRPRLLHFVSTEAYPASSEDVLRSAQNHAELLPFAEQLVSQLWGLLPGIHRLAFEDGRVLLTLCIGDTKAMLKDQVFEADSVYLDGFNPSLNPDMWDVYTLKALARCCRRGTRIATWTVARNVRDALAQCGFTVTKMPGVPPKRDKLQGEFNPAWEPKRSQRPPIRHNAGRCVVVGAGLAGAAVAASLARRGWQVLVLDSAAHPAAGASGLPAGVMAPHVSPDDSLLSRLSRSGIRSTLQQAKALLQRGSDWSDEGVLEHGVEHPRALPASWRLGQPLADAASDWTRLATPGHLAKCKLPADAPALWHVRAGWIKPAKLVHAWLATPGVQWRGAVKVRGVKKLGSTWQVLDAAGQEIASADLVVLAGGFDSLTLAASSESGDTENRKPLALQAIRGQLSWALQSPGLASALPPFPVNGLGSLISGLPWPEGTGQTAWITGATFERDCTDISIRQEDHPRNLRKLMTLLPDVAENLADQFPEQVQGWAGIRCATPTRMPALGPLATSDETPGLWISSGMGSRGLSFAALCAELLAARLHAEPLPIGRLLADALMPQYGAVVESNLAAHQSAGAAETG